MVVGILLEQCQYVLTHSVLTHSVLDTGRVWSSSKKWFNNKGIKKERGVCEMIFVM